MINPDMIIKDEDIQYILYKMKQKQIKKVQIAREIGVSPQMVHAVISRRIKKKNYVYFKMIEYLRKPKPCAVCGTIIE